MGEACLAPTGYLMPNLKIVLAVPVPRDAMIDVRTAAWCAALHKHGSVKWVWAQTESPECGRNAIIEEQLHHPEVTHFFFLDSDSVPPVDAVSRLYAMDKPAACGVTPILIHRHEHVWNVRKSPTEWWPRCEPFPAAPFLVPHVGGSCLLVQREAVEKVGYPWFHLEGKPMGAGPEYVKRGEDVFFCDRLHECGYEIWCDPTIQCDHWKKVNLLTLCEESGTTQFEEKPLEHE